MKQRRRWSKETRIAIDVADKESMPATMILERLRDGSLDGLEGRPQAMSDSTFYDILRVLRRARIDANEKRIEPGKEVEEAGAIIREGLAMAGRAIKQLKQSETAKLTPTNHRARASALKTYMTIVQDAKYRAERGEASPKTPAERGTKQSEVAPRQTAISRLVSEAQREAASPPPPNKRHDSQTPVSGERTAETQVTEQASEAKQDEAVAVGS